MSFYRCRFIVSTSALISECQVAEASGAEFQHKGPAHEGDPFLSEKVHVEEENEDAMPDEGVDLETTSWQNTVQEDHVTVIATSTSHEQEPVRMFQAAQQKAKLMEEELEKLHRNQAKQDIESTDGDMQATVDLGGRNACKAVYADLQTVLQKLGVEARQKIERAAIQAEARKSTDATALAVPVNSPLSLYAPETYPAAFVEFLYGDGTPNLDRLRPLLMEELFSALLDREELAYSTLSDSQPYQVSEQNRFNKPEIIAVMGDVQRRLSQLQAARITFQNPGFSKDVASVLKSSPDDFLHAATGVVHGPISNPNQLLQNPAVPEKIKAALRSIAFLSNRTPGTDAYSVASQHLASNMNIRFGPCSLFMTGNYSESRLAVMLALTGGVPNLLTDAPVMPSLQSMRVQTAKNGRAQAKLFLLLLELQHRHLQGMDGFLVGRRYYRRMLAEHREDDFASSLRPSIAGPLSASLTMFEAQARGFIHGHAKCHSIYDAAALIHMENMDAKDLESQVRKMQQQILESACTIQYDSAIEVARQMEVANCLKPESFTALQQAQSKFDGQVEVDGSTRKEIAITGEEPECHAARENKLAVVEQRQPRTAFTAPLTGCQLAALPRYRLLQDFSQISQLDECEDPVAEVKRCALSLPISHDKHGQVEGFRLNSGMCATEEDLLQDAHQWAICFAKDTQSLQHLAHTHSCQETCVKYAKDKLAAKETLAKGKVPLCRFNFLRQLTFCIAEDDKFKTLKVWRRGKALVSLPYVSAEEDNNMYGRSVPRRT